MSAIQETSFSYRCISRRLLISTCPMPRSRDADERQNYQYIIVQGGPATLKNLLRSPTEIFGRLLKERRLGFRGRRVSLGLSPPMTQFTEDYCFDFHE